MTPNRRYIRRVRPVVRTLAAGIFVTGCAAAGPRGMRLDAPLRPAADLPVAFTSAGGIPADGEATMCRSPIVDPRSGDAFRFASARGGIADFEVPVGRYGAREGELLRVDCRSGRGLGFVRR